MRDLKAPESAVFALVMLAHGCNVVGEYLECGKLSMTWAYTVYPVSRRGARETDSPQSPLTEVFEGGYP